MHTYTPVEVQTHIAEMLGDTSVDTIIAALAECCLDKAQAEPANSDGSKLWTLAGDQLFRVSHSDKILRVGSGPRRQALKEASIL
jgi:hypothetical protein